MAERNLVYDALVLRAKDVPSGSRVVTFLSAEAGILDAFVFGGPKSKLRSAASPWSSGRVFLYHDPLRDYLKVSDFEVAEAFSGLRDGLRRIMSASLVGELLIKTSGGGGDFPEVLGIARDTLAALETLPEGRTDYPLLLFIWRLVGVIGLLPDLGACVLCERELGPAEPRLWLRNEGGFACPRCRPETGGLGPRDGGFAEAPRLSAGALRWLERAESLPFAQAFEVGLDGASLAGLRRLAFALALEAADGPLETLRSGAGIL